MPCLQCWSLNQSDDTELSRLQGMLGLEKKVFSLVSGDSWWVFSEHCTHWYVDPMRKESWEFLWGRPWFAQKCLQERALRAAGTGNRAGMTSRARLHPGQLPGPGLSKRFLVRAIRCWWPVSVTITLLFQSSTKADETLCECLHGLWANKTLLTNLGVGQVLFYVMNTHRGCPHMV